MPARISGTLVFEFDTQAELAVGLERIAATDGYVSWVTKTSLRKVTVTVSKEVTVPGA